MNAVDTFRSKSSAIVAKLRGDFPLRHEDCFAIVGNAGHECNGFTTLQETSPTVKGSRGGWGWMQWTGPRRRAFEAYCTRNRLDPGSDEANYAWLFLELKGAEARAIPATLAAVGLEGKVAAFERSFLRAGVKHYRSRDQWAKIALQEWTRSGQEPAPMPAERKRAVLVDEAQAIEERAALDMAKGARSGGGGLVAGGGGMVVDQVAFPWADLLLFGLGAVLVGVAAWLILRGFRSARVSAALLFEAEKSADEMVLKSVSRIEGGA